MIKLLLVTALLAAPADSSAESNQAPTVISLEKELEIALSESPSVKVADKEIETKKFAKKGSYAALFPEISATGTFNRTLKKQVMSMDFGGVSQSFEVGRWNTWSGGLNAQMPLVNAQLWKSLKISGEDVELAVEKARSSRLETVNQVKQAYYGVLLAKEANKVYKDVYDNAPSNGVVHLVNCTVVNRTNVFWPYSGLYYELEDGSHLHFPNLRDDSALMQSDYSAPFNESKSEISFRQ